MATTKRFIAKNGLDSNSNTITNVADPVNATDAVTKQFITDTYVSGKLLTNFAVGTNATVAASDSILGALGKVQGQLNNKQASGSYLTSETDTLASVTGRGNTTTNAISVGALTAGISGGGTPASFSSGGNTYINLVNGGARTYRIYSADTSNNGFNGFGIYDTTGSAFRLAIDSVGSIGIGTTSPAGKLDVRGVATAAPSATLTAGDLVVDTAARTVYVGRLSDTTYDNTTFIIRNRLGVEAMHFDGSASGYTYISSPYTYLSFGTGNGTGTERMRIDASGNVGIGTTAPSRSIVNIHAANKTLASTTSIFAITASDALAADIGGSMHFGAHYDATADFAPLGYIAGRRENATSGSFAGYLQFAVTGGGAGTIEAMRINSSGNVGIGITAPAYKLDVSGDINISGSYKVNGVAFTGGTSLNGTGFVKASGTTISYDNSTYVLTNDSRLSDARPLNTALMYTSTTWTNTLNSGYNSVSDTADMWINYVGYQNGTSYFRDFRIGDGKNNAIVLVDGSTSNLTIYGPSNVPTSSARLIVEGSSIWDSGIQLSNTGTGGKKYNIFSTNNAFSQGGGGLLFYNVTDGTNPLFLTTSVATFSGTITGSNLSGTNTGDQTSVSGNAGTVTNGMYLTGGQTISAGVKDFVSGSGCTIAYTGGSANALEAYGAGGGAAMMSFHRPGAYAVYFGLDTDNVLRVGGWSMGAASYTIWHSGNTPTWNQSTTGNAATATNSSTLNGYSASNLVPFTSLRNFPNGTLITTSINYAVSNGSAFLLEIEGNTYGNIIPVNLKVQGYIYSDTLINVGGISNGLNISGLIAINNGGNLCFWFPSQGYWNGYNVFCTDVTGESPKINKVTSITNTAQPTSAKLVNLSATIRQAIHSDNIGSQSVNYATSAGSAPGTGITGNLPSSITTAGNASWGGQLQLGGNGGGSGVAAIAKVQATDGNLHLDSGVGKMMYLNYYQNGAVDISGATTIHGNISATNLSGTNTGDQNLSGYALLSGAAFTGAISVSGTLGLWSNEVRMTNGGTLYIGYSNTDAVKFGTSGNGATITAAGAGSFTGALSASNLSGTNTGDQTNISGTSAYSAVCANGSGTNSGARITNPGGAAYVTSATTVTGSIKIRLPYPSPVYGMWKMTVKIYEYGARGNGYTIELGCHLYPSYGHNKYQWMINSTNSPLPIRYGNDGTKGCIWIGEDTTVWSYPQVYVTEFQNGYNNYNINDWKDGWAISIGARDNVGAVDGPYYTDTPYANTAGYAATAGSAPANGGTSAACSGISDKVNIRGSRVDGAWYQLAWNCPGDNIVYSSSTVSILPSGYGSLKFGGNWTIEGNSTYGLYSNTGFYANGGLWDAGNRVYSAGNPQTNISGNAATANNIAGNTFILGGGSVSTSAAVGMYLNNADANYWIGKRAGAWTQPLDVAFYTGIRYHAHKAYNGHIFYVDAYDTTEAFSVGKGDANVRATNIVYASDFSASSDMRLKKDITSITDSLEKIKQINGIYYRWNETSTAEDKDTMQAGVIAQDVLKVFPEAVSNGSEYMSVSYNKLVPLLIEGMKEQQLKIEELERRLNDFT